MAEIIYLETCIASYFNGFGGHVIAVPVDAKTTRASLRQGIIDDINGTIMEDDPFNDDADMELAIDSVMANFLSEYPFADIGGDLEMPEGYFAVRNDDGSWSLYEGDEDDMENADLVEDNLPSRAGALVEANSIKDALEIEVYCYFGIKQGD